MQTKTAHALRCLLAADLAPTLADKIQALHESNMAIAKEATIREARAMIESEIAALPKFLGVEIDDDNIGKLIDQFL